MKTVMICGIFLAAIVSVSARADVVDDTIKLSQSGAGEEVIAAWADRQSFPVLNPADIIRLREAKVPDHVIAVLIRKGTTDAKTSEYAETPTYYTQTPTYYSYPSYYYSGPYYHSWRPGLSFDFRFGGAQRWHR